VLIFHHPQPTAPLFATTTATASKTKCNDARPFIGREKVEKMVKSAEKRAESTGPYINSTPQNTHPLEKEICPKRERERERTLSDFQLRAAHFDAFL